MKDYKLSAASIDRSSTCFHCGSARLVDVSYLNFNTESLTRNLAYAMPHFIAQIISRMSSRFSAAYYPVSVNKKYFNRSAVYCLDCHTGSCQPFFDKEVLANYYKAFYWANRDVADGQHVTSESKPNDRQLALARQRISWIRKHLQHLGSVIDFGAGDCAAAYVLDREEKLETTHVVDPSQRAEFFARDYGLGYSDDLAKAPMVDLIYSAHSIEHVHDIRLVMKGLLAKTKTGGHIFFETPNIGDIEVFTKLAHTPHTFMFSEATFLLFESQFPIRVVAVESCGPMWRHSKSRIRSDEKADLRVLIQKISD
jgi:SAM-dependent methyltransferase